MKSTDNENTGRLLGLGVLRDEVRQPGAYQYKIEGIEYEQIWDEEVQTIYNEAMQKGILQKAKDFRDKICNAFNYIDMHNKDTGCDVYFHESKDLLPKVPFRALIPKGSSRITVAGRIVSADRVAFAGIRAQCTCMAMGQAMGATAALAVKKGVPSREIKVKDIVALTIEHGAVPI